MREPLLVVVGNGGFEEVLVELDELDDVGDAGDELAAVLDVLVLVAELVIVLVKQRHVPAESMERTKREGEAKGRRKNRRK